MKNALHWFEIPVSDMARAKAFYEEIFNISFVEFSPNENLQMALFPAEQGTVGGALCFNKKFYKPGHQGPLVYLNADPDLEKVLERLKKKKGKILQPKTQVSEEIGFMALIEDSEGNRVGLMSRQ